MILLSLLGNALGNIYGSVYSDRVNLYIIILVINSCTVATEKQRPDACIVPTQH